MQAVSQIASVGFATVPLTTDELDNSKTVRSLAQQFFSLPEQVKLQSSSTDYNRGYRPVGQEYSQSAERPDLNESFSIWGGDDAKSFHQESTLLADAMITWQATLKGLISDILASLREFVSGPNDEDIPFAFSSYAQLNYYTRVDEQLERDLLQDAHEDGHMLTLLTAAQPGLEVAPGIDGPYEAVSPSSAHLRVMPGSALTAISGGRFPPLYHRVRNHNLPDRYSLMYFVNPDLSRPVYSWDSGENEKIDLGPAIAAKPHDFGLPSVPR
jgi:isopenicillin N synthase-like dioxygenase